MVLRVTTESSACRYGNHPERGDSGPWSLVGIAESETHSTGRRLHLGAGISLMESTDITSPVSPMTSSTTTTLDVFCADPLLRAPLAARLTGDGHLVRVHEAPQFDPEALAPGSAAVVIHPSATLDVLQGGWLPFTRQVIDRAPAVLVARAATIPRSLLAEVDPSRALVALDRDQLGSDWLQEVSVGVGRLVTGARDIAVTFRVSTDATSGLDTLTPNERAVLRLIAEGLSNSAIAEHQFVGERTVESHIRRIFAKLELPSSPAVNRRVLAARLGLGHGPGTLPIAD